VGDLHWRRKIVALKIESTYGTDPTVAATDAMLSSNMRVRPYVGPTAERDYDRTYLGARQQVNTAPHSECAFDVELAGSGSAVDDPPAWGEALRACGFNQTIGAATDVAYTPVAGDASDEFESAYLETSIDGGFEQPMPGSRGNVQFVLTPGDFPKMRYDFWGKYSAPINAALPAADTTDYADAIPVTDTNTPTCTLDGVGVVLHALNLNIGNVLASRDLPNIVEQIIIADRVPSGTITFELPDITTKDWFIEARSDDGVVTSVLNIVHGTVAFNIVTLNCPVVQLTNPQFGEADGITTLQFDLIILPSSGNDEISITTT